MTKARDISSLIGSSGQIDNTKITLDTNEIPNLDAGKITTGTFADARISNSSVVQHSTPFDDNKIVNDISTLALRQASDANRSAYSTNSQSVDVFQDDTGIDTTTNVNRNANEYVSSSSSEFVTPTISALGGTSANQSPVYSLNTSTGLITHDHTSTTTETTDAGIHGCRLDFGKNVTFSSGLYLQMTDILDVGPGNANMGVTEFNFSTSAGSNWVFQNSEIIPTVNEYSTSSQWQDMNGSSVNLYDGNVSTYAGVYTNLANLPATLKYSWTENNGTISARYVEVRFSNTWGRPKTFNIFSGATGTTSPSGTNIGQGITNNITVATGNFTGTTITAPSSVSSMGAIITYQDNAGTNALNTDIVLQLSADGGSNYSTATLTALPDFSTGIKMAKVNDLAVTAGTSLKYKISFANQASGTKEARIRGVALQY